MRLARDTYDRHLGRHGRAAPDAVFCALNLSAAYAAVGEHGRARELAAEVRAAYESSLGGGHPNTLAAANNLAIYLRCTGDLRQALQLATDTLAKLRGTLGHDHPFSLAAAVNLAACLGDTEDLPQAESLQRDTLRDLQKKLGPRHPDTLACEAGLAVTLHRAGQDEEAEHVRARTLKAFTHVDGNHPDMKLLQDWRYISRDLEAPRSRSLNRRSTQHIDELAMPSHACDQKVKIVQDRSDASSAHRRRRGTEAQRQTERSARAP